MARKVLMVMCSNSGTTFYRMYNFWVGAHRTGKGQFHVLGWDKNEISMAPWQYEIKEADKQPMLFAQLYNAAREADVIVFQRLETTWALTTLYALKDQFPGKPILAEYDDDVFDVASYNPAFEHIRPGTEAVAIAEAQLEHSDGIIVSTPYLAEVYSQYAKTYVVPNSIDVQLWDKAKRKKRPGIRIGWIGGASHAEDLKLLETVIPNVLANNQDARFVFVSASLPEFLKGIDRVDVVEKWSPILKYHDHVAGMDFDIGLAPLVDNKFNRAKSNLRWLEYSALGIPCVASDVGHFKETIHNGSDGYLAKNADEFAFNINLLVSDSKLRKRMGTAAHTRIYNDFNVDKNVDFYVKAIEDVLIQPVKMAPSMMNGVDMPTTFEPTGISEQLQETL